MPNPEIITIPIEINLTAMLAPLYGQTYPDEEWEQMGPPDPVGFLQQQVVQGLIAALATDELKQQVTKVRAELIREMVTHMLVAELNRGVTVTDSYGNVKKEATVAELVTEEVKRQLTYSRDARNDFSGKPSVMATVVKEQVERVLTTELTEDLSAAKLALRKAAREKAVEVMTAAVARAAGV